MNPSSPGGRRWLVGGLVALVLLTGVAWLVVLWQFRDRAVPGETRPVPLTAHYDRLLETFSPSVSWGAVPIGTQMLAGVVFDVRGIAEVTGMGAARNGEFHPPAIRGIAVRQKAERLHLLHGAGWNDKDGTPIARVVLHYADGQELGFDLAYGVHVRNWWIERSEKNSALADPHSEVAWTGTSPDTDRFGVTLRLFKTTLANPRPAQEIVSVDFVSRFSRAIPVLLAVSVEPRAMRTNAAPFMAPSTITDDDRAMVQVVDDGSGAPVPDATAWLELCEKSCYGFGHWKGDAQGRLLLDYPRQRTNAAHLFVVARGHAPEKFALGTESNVTVRLKAGGVAGGRVQDDAGRPIPGATVSLRGTYKDPRGTPTAFEFDHVTTDAEGRWSSQSMPPAPRRVLFAVTSSNHPPAHYVLWRDRTQSEFPVRMARADLDARQSVMVLGQAEGTYKEISAFDGWQDTGIVLEENQKFAVLAFGVWSHGKEEATQAWYGPEGHERSSARAFDPSSPVGALIARVGEQGRPFGIDQGANERAPRGSGSLWLSLNDTPASAQDNRGGLKVLIKVEKTR